jgi:transposase-like protein
MRKVKRVRRSAALWRDLFARQLSSGLAVSEFCRREGINASLFRRWRLRLNDSAPRAAGAVRADSAVVAAPFIDLGGLATVGSRFEVRLELGAGIVLSLARS